ncbi:MAG: hypothetical protein ACTSR8_10680 [Promethearchaeota archaeon]
MQLFEVIELNEYPYMETEEIFEGGTIGSIIEPEKVYLIVDHDSKRIWCYNGPKSPFKLQIYGGIIAGELRKQLKLFYRVFSLKAFSESDEVFQKVMESPIGPGRAHAIKKKDYSPSRTESNQGLDLCVHPELKPIRAIENFNELPPIEGYQRKFLIIGGNIYTDEETPEKVLQDQVTSKQQTKIGQLNRGFTFFGDNKYSLRMLVKERKIQGIELFVPKVDASLAEPLQLKIPLFYEERFSHVGSMETLLNAFEVPEQLPDVEPELETEQPEK